MKGWALWLSLPLIALACDESAAAQNFRNPLRIPTTQDPVSVFAVDLNNDGLTDLLYEISGLNSVPGTMQTLLAQTSGGYIQGPALTMPLGVGECYPADVNRDGNQDLVCVDDLGSQSAQIATFLGNGDGSFQAPFYSGFVQSNYVDFSPYLYPPAGLKSDLSSDLMIGDVNDPLTFVLLNDGTGHFNQVSTLSIGPADVPAWSVADLNGDGKPDLISPFGPAVYLGNGDGTFGAASYYGNFDSCILHDMDADGHLDAVCVTNVLQSNTYTGTNQLAILHGNADGSFNATPIASQTFGNPQGGDAAIQSPVAVVDLNGDGIPDILGASQDGLSVLLGRPSLQFAAPVHYGVSNVGGVGSSTRQVIDLNSDGIPDVVSTGASGLYITYGNKDGTFQAPPAYSVGTTLGSMTVADFNGDGIPDIAATGDQSVELSLGNSDGTFQPSVALPNGGISFASVSTGLAIAHGDFRDTGKQDILVIGSQGPISNNFYIMFNNGDGTFSAPQQLANSSVLWPNLESFTVADFNGDHRDDFLTPVPGASSPTVSVGLSNGDGTFNTVKTVLPNTGTGYIPPPAVADFDKDGKPDLVYAAGTNVNVLKGNGDGSFNTNALELAVPAYPGQSATYYRPLAVATGDFDGDGNQDFVVFALVGPWSPPPTVYTTTATALYVFYGNGNGTFSSPVIAGGSTAVYDTIYVADVNQDGRADLLLENTGTDATGFPVPGNSLGVFLSEPGRLFGQETVYEVGERSSGTFVADVNRDGYPDLLVSNSSLWAGGYTGTYSNSITELANLGAQSNAYLQSSSTALTAMSQTFVAGTSVTFTATVRGASSGGTTPTGSVRFADQTGIQSTVPLAPAGAGMATATFTASGFTTGADHMVAAYLGDGTFASSYATLPLTVTGNVADVVSVSVSPDPVTLGNAATLLVTVSNVAGSTAAAPTGTVEFFDGSAPISGTIALSSGPTPFSAVLSAPGAHNLSVRYSGDSLHVPGSASAIDYVVTTPTIVVSPPSSAVTTAQSPTVTITVNGASGNPVPTGTVSLTAGVFTSSSVTLQNGSATISIPAGALPAAAYTVTGTYTPDPAGRIFYLPVSGSAALKVIAVPVGFTLSGTAVSVMPGVATGNTSTVTLTPAGGFTGNVMLSAAVTSSPAGAQDLPALSFGSTSPAVVLGASGVTARLTVTTTAASNSAYLRSGRDDLRWCGISGASLGLMMLLGRRRRQLRWSWVLAMGLLLLAVASPGLGCGGGPTPLAGGGGGGSGSPGTTAGVYMVTVTGTSGSLSATSTIMITVQ